jgi:hypothetical protein
MATMLNPCASSDCGDDAVALLPADPFTSLRYHFGMLLGVDDFETDQAYHRGKTRLHNAWLHGEGVVWGLGVGIDIPAGELEVLPGLALDAAGRELFLKAKACLSLPDWYDAHRSDPDLPPPDPAGSISFDAHVVIRFHPCLFRQVPAFADACNGADTSTAYSRIEESVELLLRPGPSPARPIPYHRLRLLFGLEGPTLDPNGAIVPDDQDLLDARAAILGQPADAQGPAARALFSRAAALDEIDRQPAPAPDDDGSTLFPATDDCDVVLADIRGLTLRQDHDRLVVAAGTVDVTTRPSHVATSTIQELAWGPIEGAHATGGGPRIDPATVTRAGTTVTIPFTAALLAATVQPEGFSATQLGTANWVPLAVSATYDDPTKTVSLTLGTDPGTDPVRLIVSGTGPTPLLGADLVPLAGPVGGPPASANDGHDVVLMLRS